MSRQKKSKAVPVVIFLTILIAALAVLCFLIKPLVIEPQKDAIAKANADAKAAVEERNKKAEAEYKALIAELESEHNKPTNPDWPEHDPSKEWEILDLSNIPLENQTAETMTRQNAETGYRAILIDEDELLTDEECGDLSRSCLRRGIWRWSWARSLSSTPSRWWSSTSSRRAS